MTALRVGSSAMRKELVIAMPPALLKISTAGGYANSANVARGRKRSRRIASVCGGAASPRRQSARRFEKSPYQTEGLPRRTWAFAGSPIVADNAQGRGTL